MSLNLENPRVSFYKKGCVALYIMTILYGAVTFFFDNKKLILFETSDASPLLLNIILFEVLWLRYLFYITSFAIIIAIFA